MTSCLHTLRSSAGAVRFCAWLALTLCFHTSVSAQPRDWAERYAHARRALLQEEWSEAERELDALAASAPSAEQRLLAVELASIARAKLDAAALPRASLRTSDELTTLYTTAIFFGIGTSAWLALQSEPDNVAGALLPFAALAPLAAGVVALADNYRPLRRGIPHAIAAGMYLGFGEGLWLTSVQRAYASTHADIDHWGAQRISTAVWLSATAGALGGAIIGAINRPTPGRVSFTASTAIWTGALAAFAAHAFEPDDKQRAQSTYLVGALAYNVGLLAGIVFGPVVAPSVKRVRYTDLGGLAGALLVGGGYALLVDAADSRVGLGLAAVGGAAGLGIATWATRDMAPDRSHDSLQPILGRRGAQSAAPRPTLIPLRGGFMAGLSGEL
jgi:hypothetical protein